MRRQPDFTCIFGYGERGKHEPESSMEIWNTAEINCVWQLQAIYTSRTLMGLELS